MARSRRERKRDKWFIHTTPEGFRKLFEEYAAFEESGHRDIRCPDGQTRNLAEISFSKLQVILLNEKSLGVKFLEVFVNEGYGVKPYDKSKVPLFNPTRPAA